MSTKDVINAIYNGTSVLEMRIHEEQVQTMLSKATPHTIGERTIMLMDTPSHGVVTLVWVRPLPPLEEQTRYERIPGW